MSSGPGLKEVVPTLSSTNALFSPLFPEWDNACLMHYAGGRLILRIGRICAQLTMGGSMSFDVQVVNPLIALIAGILILLMPRLLNYVVAIYLIVIGVLGLAHHFNM
jgi:Protein of unknown function (DUF3096)